MKTHWHGGRCLEVQLDGALGRELFRRIGGVVEGVRESGIAAGVVGSYGSVSLYWDQLVEDRERVEEEVLEMIMGIEVGKCSGAEFLVPVRYDGEDLLAVARYHTLEAEEVVKRHLEADYTVAAVGFLAHFGYLWGLDERLVTPRLASPRTRVPVGAVGIGGSQTGIYPQASPGGWSLIGIVEEEVVREVCPQLRVGDRVRFEEVVK